MSKENEYCDHGYPGWAWTRRQMAVVVASRPVDNLLLYYGGPAFAHDVHHHDSLFVQDLGLKDPPGPGIYVWEGAFYSDEDGGSYEGAYREPTSAEWAALMLQKNPFDAEEWGYDFSKDQHRPPETFSAPTPHPDVSP